MARNEKIYSGPGEVNGSTYDKTEVWRADTDVLVVLTFGPGGELGSTPVQNPSLEFVDDHLVITADGFEFRGLHARSRLGAWLNQAVLALDGTPLHEDASVLWTDQGVTIVAADGAVVEYPGARTSVTYGEKRIEMWSGDPAVSLIVRATRRGCGGCGRGNR